MGELTHKATRAAFGKAIELTLKHVEKDREKGLLQLVDLTEKFMGDNFPSESYEGARNLIRDPESKWMQYVTVLCSPAAGAAQVTCTGRIH